MSRKSAAFAVWLVTTAFVGIVGGLYIVPQLVSLYALSKTNHVAQGEITETFPQLHSSCEYRYFVDGGIYEQAGRSCGDIQIGHHVTVYFSPSDPSRSVNHDPEALFLNDLMPFVLALVLFPIFAAALAYARPDRMWGGWLHLIKGKGAPGI